MVIDETYWIDVCPTDANLLASCGLGPIIKIYDRRVAKIAKIIGKDEGGKMFEQKQPDVTIQFPGNCFLGYRYTYITCVRWNSTGDTLAAAYGNSTPGVVDFKTEKTILRNYALEGSKLLMSFH